MEQSRKNLKNLNKKIYEKQLNLFKFMEIHKIKDYRDESIKQFVNEINLLDEIYDIKQEEYNRLRDDFWKNT